MVITFRCEAYCNTLITIRILFFFQVSSDKIKVPKSNQNSLSNVVPLFVYCLPCACLTDQDVNFLSKLKLLYDDCTVLFCVKSLSHCPYSCNYSTSMETSRNNDSLLTKEPASDPPCSSSHDARSSPDVASPSHSPQMHDDNFYSFNALTSSHCDMYVENDLFMPLDNIAHIRARSPSRLDSKLPQRAARVTPIQPFKCASRIDQLQDTLEDLGFSLMRLSYLKLRDSSSSTSGTENPPTTNREKQPKSLVFLIDDKSKTTRISVPFYFKKVLQMHITKAARLLYR